MNLKGINTVRGIIGKLSSADGLELFDIMNRVGANLGKGLDSLLDISNKENLAILIGTAANAINGQGIELQKLISTFGINTNGFSGANVQAILQKFTKIDPSQLSNLFGTFTNIPILKKNIGWIESQNPLVDPDFWQEGKMQGQRKHHEDVFKRGGQISRNLMQALIDQKGELLHPKSTHGGKDRLATPAFKIPSQAYFIKPDGSIVNFAPTAKFEELIPKGYVKQPSGTADKIYNKTAPGGGLGFNPRKSYSDQQTGTTSQGSASQNTNYTKYVGTKGVERKPGLVLSPNFLIEDLTSGRSHPKLKGQRKVPLFSHRFTGNKEHIANLAHIANNVLEPLLKKYGEDLIINSGWRPGPWKRGKRISQHWVGEAVDFSVVGYESNMYPIAQEIKGLIPYDQFILEYNKSSWIHISLKRNGRNRGKIFTMNRHSVVGNGLINMRKGRL